jgi:microcystin-dependent protein
MWYGAKDKIPSGWVACDGSNDTPDLRGQFVRMYSDDLTFPGGSNFTTLDVSMNSYGKEIAGKSIIDNKTIIFNHKIKEQGGTDLRISTVDEMPRHTHNINWIDDRGKAGRWAEGPSWATGSGNDVMSKNASTNFGNAGIKLLNAGESGYQNNQPPYYVMTYIMKK